MIPDPVAVDNDRQHICDDGTVPCQVPPEISASNEAPKRVKTL